jgi:putative YphP/YqiW family bacilliredoxin
MFPDLHARPGKLYIASPSPIEGEKSAIEPGFASIGRQRPLTSAPISVINMRLQIARERSEMYPELMVIPMREELTRLGIQELRTAAEVDAFLQGPGTAMIMVNSICGCAAGRMRPAVRLALEHETKPEKLATVFAGQDREATERARSYLEGSPPSSPAIALLREGKLLHLMQRSDIEHREAEDLAAELTATFDRFCKSAVAR